MKVNTIGVTISGILITLIFFAISFMITNKLLNTFEKNEIEENTNIEQEELPKDSSDTMNKEETNFFEGVIISIEGKNISVENPSHLVDYSIYEGDMNWHNEHKVVSDGKLYVTASYLLFLDNVPIEDCNGNEIDISKLKVGDTIKVFTENIRYTESTISTPITSDYIKLIERK